MRGSAPVTLSLFLLFAPAIANFQTAESVELRPINSRGWPWAAERDGSDSSEAGLNRNRQKNRPWTPAKAKVDWSVSKFTETASMYDLGLQIVGQTRGDLLLDSPAKLATVNRFEDRLVSVTGYLGYAYSGGPEAANYGSLHYHDWHLELYQNPVTRRLQRGDETPVVCEVTRFTERRLYDKGIRLQKLAAFLRIGRNGALRYIPTGHASQRVRITGYLFWDDSHNQPSVDIGPQVVSTPKKSYHRPWRQTAWEIHPVTNIEVLGKAK